MTHGIITDYVHYCPIGCHSSIEAVQIEVEADMREAHLDVHVGVPAVNRWVKLGGPLAYFTVGTVMGWLPQSFASIQTTLAKDDLGVLDIDEMLGPGGDNTHAKTKKVACLIKRT